MYQQGNIVPPHGDLFVFSIIGQKDYRVKNPERIWDVDMGSPAKVTSIEAGRITEGRTLYNTTQGKQKETYLGIPYSLLPRLYESSLAEVRMQLYVWQRTGGWKDYHAHPQPARITFAEWTGGRSGYAQDDGAHLCTQEITTTRDALVACGWLYEEWETPHVRGPRRYALIAPDNPGIGPYQRETDGTWEVLLITDEGPQPYQIPETVLQYRIAGEALLQHRIEPLLQDRKASSTTSKSSLLQGRKEKSRRAFPRQGPAQPITNSLANSSNKQELAKGAADAASVPDSEQNRTKSGKRTLSAHQLQGNVDISRHLKETTAPAAELINKPPLFPAVEMPAQVPLDAQAAPQLRRGRRAVAEERKQRPPNPMYEVWKQHIGTPPGSAREITSICTGLAELSNPALTEGKPVALDELPALIYQVESWIDRRTGQNYTPTPRLIAEWLSKLRNEIINSPAPKVRAWLAGYLPLSEAECTASRDLAEEYGEGHVDQVTGPSSPDTSDPSTELVDDPAWITQLSRLVPDAEGVRDGRQSRDVQMLWGFVRDALRPGLNTARRQHLDSLVPAWNPTAPRELVLLGSTSYTIRFANMAMQREINELIGKLLNRFFDHARLVFVRQEVIDHLQKQHRKV